MVTKNMRATRSGHKGLQAAAKEIDQNIHQHLYDTTVKYGPPVSHPAGFWTTFRISPIRWEHTMLTNMGWLTLISLGPLCLWSVLGIIHDAIKDPQRFSAQNLFSNFKDPVFTTLTLSAFFGTILFRYRLYPAIRKAFQSVLENDVLREQNGSKLTESEFAGSLNNYLKNLHSQKRYILVVPFLLFILAEFLWTSITRDEWSVSDPDGGLRFLSLLHTSIRWVLAPALWSYVGMTFTWILIQTTQTVMDLTPRYEVNVHPLHSDRAGGFKRLGDLCSYAGLLVIVIVIPAIVLAVQRTMMSTDIRSCGSEMQQFSTGQAGMSQDRLIDCIFYASARFEHISPTDLSDYITSRLANGSTLEQVAGDFYANKERLFQKDAIFEHYSIYYVVDIILLFAVLFAFYVFIGPLLDIHTSMAEFKQRRELEVNKHIDVLVDKMKTFIKQDNFKEADQIKSNVNFLLNELNEIENYPRWPISSRRTVRTYLTSSFVTALVTYLISVLQLSISAEASGALNEGIKLIFGT